MLVIVLDEQILSTEKVCPSCLLANAEGSPRWRNGKLKCGRYAKPKEANQTSLHECQMGFKLAHV